MKFNLIYTNCYCFKRIIEISKNLGYITLIIKIFSVYICEKINYSILNVIYMIILLLNIL